LGSAVAVDRLRVSGIPAPFLKRFRLEGSGDRSHWTLLVNEGTLFDLPSEHLQNIETGFAAGEYRYFRLTWNNQNSGVVSTPGGGAARVVEARHAPEPLRAMVEFTRLAAGPGHSRFQVRLPGPHLPLSAIELQVNETRLLRPARVIESRMSGGSVTADTLGSATLRRVVQENSVAADMRIPIRAPQGREIEILVDDNSNPPLNLSGVMLEFSRSHGSTLRRRPVVASLPVTVTPRRWLRSTISKRFAETFRKGPARGRVGKASGEFAVGRYH
jgi:hypothetical protein